MKKKFLLPFIMLLFATANVFSGANQIKPAGKPSLVLYYSPYCPYSKKVTNYLIAIHKTIPMKDVSSNNQYREELRKIGGKSQVPCLVINGKALYESDMIIQWINENQEFLDASTVNSK